MDIGESLLTPYYRSKPTITITAIQITTMRRRRWRFSGRARWSTAHTSSGAAKGEVTTVPTALNTPGSFLVRVESYLEYRLVITWAAADKKSLGMAATFAKISMKETYYLRPRMSSQVTCSDC